jgi:hypothetical protein
MHKHPGHYHPADPNPSLHIRQKSKRPESVLLCVFDGATCFGPRMHIGYIVGFICNILGWTLTSLASARAWFVVWSISHPEVS